MIRRMETMSVRAILPLIQQYQEHVRTDLFKVLDYIGAPTAPKFDDPHDIISRAIGSIRVGIARYLSDTEIGKIIQGLAYSVQALNRATMNQQFKSVLSVNPMMSEPWIIPQIEAFVKQNISLIRSVPTENLADIEQMLYRDAQRKLSPKAMQEKIEEQLDVAEFRAELIARDQVGKFNGALTELRQTNLGIGEYVWRTSEDERVRPDHARLNGTTQKWSEPPITVTSGKRAGERNHPGMDIQCRCYAEPVLSLPKK